MAIKDLFKKKSKVSFDSTGGIGANAVDITSLTFKTNEEDSIEGLNNRYKTYGSQVISTYKKYNSLDDYGNLQLKTLVDILTGFIAGEGLNISATNPKTAKWLLDFTQKNKLYGSRYINTVKGTVMTGKQLLVSYPDPEEKRVKVLRVPYGVNTSYSKSSGLDYRIILSNRFDPDSIEDIVVLDDDGKQTSLGLENFVYIRTGGDDLEVNNTVTKVGACLTDCENYDRAIKDLRKVNNISARPTLTFKTDDADNVKAALQKGNWKIGDSYIGPAELSYVTPNIGGHQNTVTEVTLTVKNISGATGIPIHWFGHVDLMSNRSTAESLMETVNVQTALERTALEDGFKELFLEAMALDINNGFGLTEIDDDFTVKIPFLTFANAKVLIESLSMAYSDNAISIQDYRNRIPGTNPLQTERDIAQSEQDDFKNLKTDLNLNANEDLAKDA